MFGREPVDQLLCKPTEQRLQHVGWLWILSNHQTACQRLWGFTVEDSRENLALQVQAFTKWLDEEEGKQGKLAAHEEPVLQSSTVSARVLQLRSAFDKLNKKKKPAPPPAPKQEANTTGEQTLSAPCLLFYTVGT